MLTLVNLQNVLAFISPPEMHIYYNRVLTDNFHEFCIICVFQGLFQKVLKREI